MDRSFAVGRRPGRAVSAALGVLAVAVAAGADGGGVDLDGLGHQARRLAGSAAVWVDRTPPADRVVWGGLAAAASLGLSVLLERSVRLRRKRTMPAEFGPRFLERLKDGELGRGKALDYCELNPSPAARVALAAVKRWGRPVVDLERAVALAHRVEADRLRRHVGTLRRLAALTPLIGLLGTLVAASRALASAGSGAVVGSWGPALSQALWPLTAGVAIATLALVAYDGLAGRVEQLVGALDRVGAETVDAIAMAVPLAPPPRPSETPAAAPPVASAPPGPARTPHQVRMEVPKPTRRIRVEDHEDYE